MVGFAKAKTNVIQEPTSYDFETLLVDGDLLVFSSCSAIEYGKEPDEYSLKEVTANVERRLIAMKRRVKAKKMKVFFSSPDNYRYVVLPEYKANRKGVARPETLKDAINWVRDHFDTETASGLEADDLLAIRQDTVDLTTVIATIDKDIPQVRGHHYRWETQHKGECLFKVEGNGELHLEVKNKKKKVTGNGIRFFCYQLLIGDPTDGIIGCGAMEDRVYKTGVKAGEAYRRRVGIGAVKAFELLEHAITYNKCMGIVIAQYKTKFGEAWKDRLLAYGRCLYMTSALEDDGTFRLWDFEPGKVTTFNPHTQTLTRMEG